LVTQLQRSIQVSGHDNVFTIEYEDTSRDEARAVVTAILDTFVGSSIGDAGTDTGVTERALAGEIKNFTGVDQPYEVPEFADLHLHGDRERPEVLADRVIAHLCDRKILKR